MCVCVRKRESERERERDCACKERGMGGSIRGGLPLRPRCQAEAHIALIPHAPRYARTLPYHECVRLFTPQGTLAREILGGPKDILTKTGFRVSVFIVLYLCSGHVCAVCTCALGTWCAFLVFERESACQCHSHTSSCVRDFVCVCPCRSPCGAAWCTSPSRRTLTTTRHLASWMRCAGCSSCLQS